MLEEVSYPLSILLVGLLTPNSLDILWVSQADIAGFFEDIENRSPVFTS